ncbi:MAG: metalloregulator ArsR/SmtB family transcription factor [Bacillota bacterium]
MTERVRLLYSPLHELFCSLHVLVYPTARYTFAIPWAMQTRSTMAADLRRQIDDYRYATNLWLGTGLLLHPLVDPTAPVEQAIEQLRTLPLATFLWHLAARRLGDEAMLHAWLEGRGPAPDPNAVRLYPDEDPAVLRRVVAEPEAERGRILRILETYWARHFRPVLAEREPLILRSLHGLAAQLRSAPDEESFLEQLFDRVRFDPERTRLIVHKQNALQEFTWAGTGGVFVIPSTFTAPHLASGGYYNRVLLTHPIPHLPEPDNEPPDELVKALADGTRLKILRRLLAGEATTQDLAREFGITEPTVSRHLQKLKGPGLVSSRKEVHYMYYLGNPAALEAVLERLRRYLLTHPEGGQSR